MTSDKHDQQNTQPSLPENRGGGGAFISNFGRQEGHLFEGGVYLRIYGTSQVDEDLASSAGNSKKERARDGYGGQKGD